MRSRATLLARGLIEGGVIALVCAAPWAFGATSAKYEFFLDVALAGLLALWAARILLDGRVAWRWCPASACLLAMVLVAHFQMAPLPRGVLRVLSPATARLYDRLLPDRPEVLPGGAPAEGLRPAAGSTLTFDRGLTRREAARLLAVLALFAMVRANVDPAAGLRRFSLALTANGTLLALFGLIQAFSSEPQTVYWWYGTIGSPFGPFINRNHFAFYGNVCVGLAVGLLLARARAIEGRGSRAGLLLDPEGLGLLFAAGVMICGVLSSLSRGGFLGLSGGLLCCVLLLATGAGGRSLGGWAVLVAPAVALALIAWIGHGKIAARLATLPSGEALREQRTAIWLRALPVVRDFPLWGTGAGTYAFADMLHRADAEDEDMVVDHAHNDYLELLVEGGLALAIPGLLALMLILRASLRGSRRPSGSRTGALAVGATMAMASVAIHSGTDFGMHIPSCTALVTALGALVIGGGGRGRRVVYLRGLVPPLAAGLAMAASLPIVAEGWRAYRAERVRAEAADLDQSRDSDRLARKAALLESAARLAPDDYLVREELAAAHLDAYDQGRYELSQPEPGRPVQAPDPAALRRLEAEALAPGLGHLLRSRDLSPARAIVHLEIADRVAGFRSAEPRGTYLERAKLLAPADPDLWYRCGLFEIEEGRLDRAWASWRHSLALSGRRLPEILDRCAPRLSPRQVLDLVLPPDPGLLAEAAGRQPDGSEGRRLFLEAALPILQRKPSPTAGEAYLRATICRSLGRHDEALESYRAALAEEPMRHEWRLELAELAADRGQYDESKQELLFLVGLRPEDARARALLERVNRKIAEGK